MSLAARPHDDPQAPARRPAFARARRPPFLTRSGGPPARPRASPRLSTLLPPRREAGAASGRGCWRVGGAELETLWKCLPFSNTPAASRRGRSLGSALRCNREPPVGGHLAIPEPPARRLPVTPEATFRRRLMIPAATVRLRLVTPEAASLPASDDTRAAPAGPNTRPSWAQLGQGPNATGHTIHAV